MSLIGLSVFYLLLTAVLGFMLGWLVTRRRWRARLAGVESAWLVRYRAKEESLINSNIELLNNTDIIAELESKLNQNARELARQQQKLSLLSHGSTDMQQLLETAQNAITQSRNAQKSAEQSLQSLQWEHAQLQQRKQ